MTDLNQHERSRVTRQDRAIYDEEWITALLNRAGMGTLATVKDEQPFLVTLLFVYDPSRHAIYIHKGKRGRAQDNLSENPRVCFTVAEMGRLLPAVTALNFSVEYQSVVVFGSAVPVEDPVEAEQSLQALLDKYFSHLKPGIDYRPITPTELDATAVYRIDIEEWSGKRKQVDEDFPGAFLWGK